MTLIMLFNDSILNLSSLSSLLLKRLFCIHPGILMCFCVSELQTKRAGLFICTAQTPVCRLAHFLQLSETRLSHILKKQKHACGGDGSTDCPCHQLLLFILSQVRETLDLKGWQWKFKAGEDGGVKSMSPNLSWWAYLLTLSECGVSVLVQTRESLCVSAWRAILYYLLSFLTFSKRRAERFIKV